MSNYLQNANISTRSVPLTIGEKVTNLNQEVDSLINNFELLAKKLQPILSSNSQLVKGSTENEVNSSSSLGESLTNLTLKIMQINEDVGTLEYRVDL